MASRNSINESNDYYPPGTIILEANLGRTNGDVIRHPIPTQDPNDPLNWPNWYKSVNYSLVCLYTLFVFVKLDIGTVAWAATTRDLGFTLQDNNFSYGFASLGIAFGCMIFIPFGLKFGRRPVYLVSVAIIFGSTIRAAKMRTVSDLWGSNILGGLSGAVSETLCQMTISDVFFVHQRATANGIFLFMLNVGAFLGPVAAGYDESSQGWRWPFWWTAILLGILFLLFLFAFEETKYTPVHRGWAGEQPEPASKPDAVWLEKSILADNENIDRNDIEHQIELATKNFGIDDDDTGSIPRHTYLQRLALFRTSPGNTGLVLQHVYLPYQILCTMPLVLFTAVVYGSTLAWFSVIVSTYSSYLTEPPYNFSSSGVGLMSLAPFIGCIIGAVYGGPLNDWLIIRLARRNGGMYEPEMRLWLALPTIVLLPGSILFFGLTVVHELPWILPAVGAAIYGFCLTALSAPVLTYCMDAYQEIIGDSFIAITFIRNGFAAIMTFGLTAWIDRVGLEAVFWTCAGIGLAICLTLVSVMIYGKRLRQLSRKRLCKFASKQLDQRG